MASVLDYLAGGVSGVVKDAAAGLFSGVAEIIGKFKADPEKAMQHEEVLRQIEAALAKDQLNATVALNQAQAKVNEIEAASQDWVQRRWRPSVGWTCVLGLNMAFFIGPFFTWISGWIATGKPGPFPTPDTGLLIALVTSMLGTATLRTYERLQGASK